MTSPHAPARPLRLFYAAGPGDVAGTFEHWLAGRDDPRELAMTYSGQFFDLCKRRGAEAMVVASHPRYADVSHDGIRVLHRPVPWQDRGGVRYHAGQIRYARWLAREARRFGAEVVVAANLTHWFALGPLPRETRLVPALHCVLWPVTRPPGRTQRQLNRLNRAVFARRAAAVLSISDDASLQAREVAGGVTVPVVPFVPTYRPARLAQTVPPPASRQPFRLLYAGRIERNKGVFLLIDALAAALAQLGPGRVTLDMCGDGSQLAALRQAVQDRGLGEVVALHGHVPHDVMRARLDAAHAVVVPTTTDFVEGFNKVVVEAVLCGRPCITSRVCPALEHVRDAVVEVEPDSAPDYARAIITLAGQADVYERAQQACARLREPFLDPARGWAAALERALDQPVARRA